MSPKARREVARVHKLCYNCLRAGHFAEECKKDSVCSVPGCGRRHTKFIHVDSPTQRVMDTSGSNKHNNIGHGLEKSDANDGNANIASNASANAFGTNVYLPIVAVRVNKTSQAYALLDSGSINTFISE